MLLLKFSRKLNQLSSAYDSNKTGYDEIYDFLEGWIAYSKLADTLNLRKRLLKTFMHKFENEMSFKEINRLLKI